MNKFAFINNPDSSQEELEKLALQVRKRIDDYLHFIDCDTLLKSSESSALIFGGAVRDSIANQEIHDVDILTLPKATKEISLILQKHSFKVMHKYNLDIATLYENSIINEPVTLYQGNTFVQLIRPRLDENNIFGKVPVSEKILISLIQEVDLSCCGISFFPDVLKEHIHDAIDDCKNLRYRILHRALYNKKRIDNRCEKLQSRGWKELSRHDVILKQLKQETFA